LDSIAFFKYRLIRMRMTPKMKSPTSWCDEQIG